MAEEIVNLPIFQVTPNSDQARKNFKDEELRELADSIRENGVISPILVTPIGPDQYEIIAGERRWRASMLANKTSIPAIIRDLDFYDKTIQSLIENVQREDLNPIAEAQAYQFIIDNFDLSHQDVAKAVGKSRSAVSNSLRLLTLPTFTKDLLTDGKLSNGHAKVLMRLRKEEDIVYMSAQIIKNAWSVKEADRAIDDFIRNKREDSLKRKVEESTSDNKSYVEEYLAKLETSLSQQLSTKVSLTYDKDKGGSLKVDYYNLEDLERLADLLNLDLSAE